jgi:hypothetical protein
LWKALGLTPDQITRFEDNAIERDAAQGDLVAAANIHKISYEDPVIVKLLGQINSDYDIAQRALLGDYGHARWRDYERAAPVRDSVRAIAAAAAVDGIPFTSPQTQRLIEMLASAMPMMERVDRLDPTRTDWTAVMAQARQILTPEQFAYFESVEAPATGAGGLFHMRWNAALQAALKAENTARATRVGSGK